MRKNRDNRALAAETNKNHATPARRIIVVQSVVRVEWVYKSIKVKVRVFISLF